MAPPVNLYRFRIDLSDVTRGTYDTLDFRLAQHPSESAAFLLTRMLAYALNVQPGLEFSSKGLAEPDEPCLSMPSERRGLALWIEVGNPSARRLHKAAKAAARVVVLTYKNPRRFSRRSAPRACTTRRSSRFSLLSPPSSLRSRSASRRTTNGACCTTKARSP